MAKLQALLLLHAAVILFAQASEFADEPPEPSKVHPDFEFKGDPPHAAAEKEEGEDDSHSYDNEDEEETHSSDDEGEGTPVDARDPDAREPDDSIPDREHEVAEHESTEHESDEHEEGEEKDKSYSYDEEGEEGERESDDDEASIFDALDENSPWSYMVLVLLVVLQVPVVLACFKTGPLYRHLAKRHAMQMARENGLDAPAGGVSNLFGVANPVKVVIDLNGMQMTIGAPRDHLTSVSQLPFTVTEACVDSGYPELVDLDLVGLLIQKQATIALEDTRGVWMNVDATTSTKDIQAAKAVRVRVSEQKDATEAPA